MNEKEMLRAFEEKKAIITNSHLVYKAGDHGSAYVNKDAIYPYTSLVYRICKEVAKNFQDQKSEIDIVAAPAVGGVILGQYTAYHLNLLKIDYNKLPDREILSVYAEDGPEGTKIFKRGYDKLIPGKKVLVVDDVLTTGSSVKEVVGAIRKLGGEVVAVTVLCNRGGVKAEDLGVPKLFALTNIILETWPEKDCPLCAKGVPVNTEVGKGREYLDRKAKN